MEVELRPSFRCYAAIEERLGSVYKALDALNSGSLKACATIIWAGVTDGGRDTQSKHTLDSIGEAVLAQGALSVVESLISFITTPLHGLSAAVKEGSEDSDSPGGEKSAG